MEPTSPPMPVLLNLYVWVLLLGGLTALVFDFRADARGAAMKLRPWNTGWLDFALFAWLLVVLTVFAQLVTASLLDFFGVSVEDISGHVLAQGLAFHGVAIALIIWKYTQPEFSKILPASPEPLRSGQILSLVLRCFFAGMLLALLIGKAWEGLLSFYAESGFIAPQQPQELVKLFADEPLGWRRIALIFLAVVVAPVSEEFVFRVGLYRFLKGRFTARIALVVSSLLFACMHFNILSFLPLFLVGMLLCRAYERSGNVLVPIGFHALFNANNIALLILIGPEATP